MVPEIDPKREECAKEINDVLNKHGYEISISNTILLTEKEQPKVQDKDESKEAEVQEVPKDNGDN